MKRLKFWLAALCLSVLTMGLLQPGAPSAGTMDLISTLVDTLGITQKQAMGGTGALFKNAKDNLSDDDFGKVSDAVPGMDGYLSAAPAEKSGSGLGGVLGNTLSSLGGGGAKAGSMASLTDAFSALGMDSGTLGKFIPVVLDFVQSEGGQNAVKLLKGLWQ